MTVALKEQIKAGYEEELNVLAKFEGKVEEICKCMAGSPSILPPLLPRSRDAVVSRRQLVRRLTSSSDAARS